MKKKDLINVCYLIFLSHCLIYKIHLPHQLDFYGAVTLTMVFFFTDHNGLYLELGLETAAV